MKKIIFFLLVLPFGAMAQSIVGETGANGEFVVGTSSTGTAGGPMDTTFSINPTSNEVIIGKRESVITPGTLPAGNIQMIHEGGSERVNIIAAPGSGFTAFPKLQFFYTPGSLNNPIRVANNSILGVLNFGGWSGSFWRENMAEITAEVDGVPATAEPTRLSFTTRQDDGNLNLMTFDSGGNLDVQGSVTSSALKSVDQLSNASQTVQLTLSDEVVICTVNNNGVIVLELPVESAANPIPIGKTYTVKRLDGGSQPSPTVAAVSIFATTGSIENSSTRNIEDNLDFVKIIYVGSDEWFIIGESN